MPILKIINKLSNLEHDIYISYSNEFGKSLTELDNLKGGLVEDTLLELDKISILFGTLSDLNTKELDEFNKLFVRYNNLSKLLEVTERRLEEMEIEIDMNMKRKSLLLNDEDDHIVPSEEQKIHKKNKKLRSLIKKIFPVSGSIFQVINLEA